MGTRDDRRVRWFDGVEKERGFSERYKGSQKALKENKIVSSEKFTAQATADLQRLQKRIERMVQKDEVETQADHSSLLPTARAPVSAIRAATIMDIQKTHDYRQVTCFVLFLVIVTITTFVHLLRDQSDAYYTLDSVSVSVLSEDFDEKVHNWDTWWSWVLSAAPNIEALVPASPQAQIQGPGLPLGFLLIRQWRVRPHPCETPALLSASARTAVSRRTCYPLWSPSTASDSLFGDPNNPFRPDSHEETALKGNPLRGRATSYEADPVFSMLLVYRDSRDNPYYNTSGVVNNIATGQFSPYISKQEGLNYSAPIITTNLTRELLSLRDRLFINEATSAVSIEVMGYMATREQFFETILLAEAKPAGDIITSHTEKLFKDFSWEGDRQRFAFVVDLVSCLYLVYFTYNFLWNAYFHLRLADSVTALVGFWRFFDVVFIVVWFLSFYYKLSLWNEGRLLGENSEFNRDHVKNYGGTPLGQDKFMRFFLQRLVVMYDEAMLWQGWGMLLVWMRLLMFLSHTERFGVVTRGVQRMAPVFFGISAMFLLVVVGLSISGVLIYSSDFIQFSTLGDAIALALRFIFTQEITCKRGGSCVSFDDMETTDRVMTSFYINLIMVLGFLVFLNLLVALVIGNLIMMQEGADKSVHDWSPETLWKEVVSASKRMRPAWLSRLFEPISEAIRSQQKENVETGGKVVWADLEQGDHVLVRKTSKASWEPATVFEVISIPGYEVPYITVKRRSQRSHRTEMIEEFADVHRELPSNLDTIRFSAHAKSMEERYVALATELQTMPPGATLRKEDWLQVSRESIPGRSALKIFDRAHTASVSTSKVKTGEDLAASLGRRINLLATYLNDREPHLQLVPILAKENLMTACDVLEPLSMDMVAFFGDVRRDMRSLTHSIVTDVDDVSIHFAKELGSVSDRQLALGSTLQKVVRRRAQSLEGAE